MIAPLNEITRDPWYFWHVLAGIASGYGGTRVLNTIVKAMPVLPENSGWWSKWAYAALQGIADTEPQGGSK